MPTWTALTTLMGKAPAERMGEALEAFDDAPTGVGVFEVEDGSGLWEVGAYFTDKPDETALLLLTTVFGAKPFTVSQLPETDWVAHVRRELAPVEAGRFFVYGSHDADKVPEGLWHRAPWDHAGLSACAGSVGGSRVCRETGGRYRLRYGRAGHGGGRDLARRSACQ